MAAEMTRTIFLVLPILSKLFEKHICEHLHNFLKDKALLHQLQSGFCKSHSTETTLVCLVDQLLFDLDRNKVFGLVFVDYNDVHLFRDYLSGRSYIYIYIYIYIHLWKRIE